MVRGQRCTLVLRPQQRERVALWERGTTSYVIAAAATAVHGLRHQPPLLLHRGRSTDGAALIQQPTRARCLCASVDRKGNSRISVPIEVTKGINGHQPQIALFYSSGASPALKEDLKSEGVLGYGWSLAGLQEIRRCRVGIGGTVQHDSTDRLCLNGNPLIKVNGAGYWADNAHYRTEIDSQTKIQAHGVGLSNRWFKVYRQDGRAMWFGDTAQTRVTAPGETDPYLWSVRVEDDANGNRILYYWDSVPEIGTNFINRITFANSEVRFRYMERCTSPTMCDSKAVQNGENVPGVKDRVVVLNRVLTRVGSKWVNDYRIQNVYDSNGYLRVEKIQNCRWNESGGGHTCQAPTVFGWDTLSVSDGTTTNDQLVVDEITDAHGAKTNFNYQVIDGWNYAVDHPLHVAAHADFSGQLIGPFDMQTQAQQRVLVEDVRRPNGLGGQTTSIYRYHGYPYYSTKGRGYVGFLATFVEHYDNKMRSGSTSSHYDGHVRVQNQYMLHFPFIGNVARSITDVDTIPGSGTRWSTVSKSMWSWRDDAASGSQTSDPRLVAHYEIGYDLKTNGYLGYGSASRTTYDYCWKYLSSGNCSGSASEYPTKVTTETQVGLRMTTNADSGSNKWAVVDDNAAIADVTRYVEQESEISNIVTPKWLIGFVEKTATSWAGASASYGTAIVTEFSRDSASSNQLGVAHYFPGDSRYDRTISMSYDSFGNVTGTTDSGAWQVTSTSSASSFLDNRYPTIVTNAMNHSSTLAYDVRFGTVKSVTDPNSDVRTITRDNFGRVTSEVSPDGTTVTTTYTACSSGCSAVTWATPRMKLSRSYTNNGAQVAPDETTYLDVRGNVVLTETEAYSASDGLTRVQYHYGPGGKLLKQSLPYFSVGGTPEYIEYFYDYKAREVLISRPDGSSIERDIYADNGTGGYVNVEETETGENRTKRYRYNRLGQLADTTDAFGTSDAVTTSYTYTDRGELDTVRVDGTLVADMGYDHAGNRTTIWEPNSGTTTYTYFSHHRVQNVTDALNKTSRYTLDALGRISWFTEDYQGANQIQSNWIWDTATNGKGRLKQRSRGSEITEVYTYDSVGRLDTITATVDVTGFNDTGPYVFDYGYDGNGRLSTISYPNLTVTNEFTSRGYLNKVKKGSTTLQHNTAYDAFGNVTAMSYGNGIQTTHGFDPETGRLTSIATGTASLPKSVQDLIYEWQTDGSLDKRIDKRGTSSTSDDLTETFVYDKLGRLESASTAATSRDLTYTYDDHGNLLSKLSDISGDLDVSSYSYPTASKPHQLSTVNIGGISNTLTYNALGSITRYDAASGDDTYIGYDDANRVTKITVGSSATDTTPTARDEFWYGPDGQRFLRKGSWMDGSTLKHSWTLYLLGGVFEEAHPEHSTSHNYRQRVLVSQNVLHRYVNWYTGSGTYVEYLHRDHLGSISEITHSAGHTVRETDFDPFGGRRDADWDADMSAADIEIRANDEDTYGGRGFTDHEMLNRTGFVHMNGRVYDPRIGRFIQADPIVGSPDMSQNYNRYVYVFNNPLAYADPTGLDKADCGKSGCGSASSNSATGGAGGSAGGGGSIAHRHRGQAFTSTGFTTEPITVSYTEKHVHYTSGRMDVIVSNYQVTGGVGSMGASGGSMLGDIGAAGFQFANMDDEGDQRFAQQVKNASLPTNSDVGSLGVETVRGLDFSREDVVARSYLNHMGANLQDLNEFDNYAVYAIGGQLGTFALGGLGGNALMASPAGQSMAYTFQQMGRNLADTRTRQLVLVHTMRLFNTMTRGGSGAAYQNVGNLTTMPAWLAPKGTVSGGLVTYTVLTK